MFLVKYDYRPETINLNNNSNSLMSKPDWLRVKAPQVERIGHTANLLSDLNLNTVCQEASCPNIGECLLVELQLSS